MKYYKILKVPYTATDADIKRAYKRMAKQWHPDTNPGSKVTATRRFQEIAEAYSILGNPVKRGRYDLEIENMRQNTIPGRRSSYPGWKTSSGHARRRRRAQKAMGVRDVFIRMGGRLKTFLRRNGLPDIF